MRVKFWGTRGSIPTPGATTVKYGGNTPCVEVAAGGCRFVLDSGTGIRELGRAILAAGESAPVIHLLISHAHWDHIQGFPFFAPIFNPKAKIYVYACQGTGHRIEKVLGMQMDDDYFPLSFQECAAEIKFVEIADNPFNIGPVRIESTFLNHPGLALGFSLSFGGRKLTYCSDTEPFRDLVLRDEPGEKGKIGSYVESLDRRIVEFTRGTEVLIIDGMFTEEEYLKRLGWGHSSVSDAVEVGISAGVKRLYIFHHEPVHDDAFIDSMILRGRKYIRDKASRLELFGAREGDAFEV